MWRDDQKQRYARQWILPAWSEEVQKKLAAARVLVVGAGGLGSPTCYYLAAAGIGKIILADPDTVELSNLNRQILHTTKDIGRPKVQSAAEKLEALNPDCKIEARREKITEKNAADFFNGVDAAIDCTDGFANKYLLNDSAVEYNVPLVHAGVLAWSGQLFVVMPKRGPCLRCIFPKPPKQGTYPTSATVGILGTAAGVFGVMEANEAIKIVAGIGEPLIGRMMVYDGLIASWQILNIKRDPKCPVCGGT